MLVAYQDGELAPSAAHLITGHLQKCAPCERYADRLSKLEIPLPIGPTIEQTVQMHASVRDAIEEAWLAPAPSPPRTNHKFKMSMLPIAILVLGLFSLTMRSPKPSPSPENMAHPTSAGVITPDKHWF